MAANHLLIEKLMDGIIHQLHSTDTSFSVFRFPIAAALARKSHEKKHQSNEEQRGRDIDQAR
jgi:hypothetical protein